jgi:hypothetical protein
MNIERVYCVEMREVVNIYRARDFYFSRTPREELTFLCSDVQCRKAGTKVTGVNYRKTIEEADKFVRPHFRKNDDHLDTCEWVEREEARQEVKEESINEANQNGEGIVKSKAPKSTDIVDVFKPKSTTDKESSEPSEEDDLGIRNLPGRRERIEAYKKQSRTNLTKANRLEEVVSCYEGLDFEGKSLNYLVIKGARRRTYQDCFRHVKRYVPGRDDWFIFFGGATVESLDQDFKLSFFDPVFMRGRKYEISLYLTKERLNVQKRQGAYLREMLTELASDKRAYAKCYFYGRVKSSEKIPNCLNIMVDDLSNLVLIKRSNRLGPKREIKAAEIALQKNEHPAGVSY